MFRANREKRRGISVKGNMLSIFLIISFVVGTVAVAVVGTASPTSVTSPMPVIHVEPTTITAEVGEALTVDITIADIASAKSLYGWDFSMSFDPSILNVTSVMEGAFLKTAGSTSWGIMPPKIDNYRGWVNASDGLWTYPPKGAVGSGTLANITFQVKAEGKTTLHFKKTQLWAYDGTWLVPIDHTAVDGVFAYPRDIAVTGVAASPGSVPAGEPVSINVTVKNESEVAETFNITIYYDNTAIETQTVTNLASLAETTLTFTWDTTGIAAGSYMIKAEASTFPGEADTANNVDYTDEKVTIELVHDIAIIEVTPSSTSVPAGEPVSINVTVKNEGSATETFNVTVLYDSTDIETKTVTDLVPGNSETLSFSWDTKDIVEGNYTLTAVASEIDGETDTADNTYTNVVVTVTMPSSALPVELFIAIIIALATMCTVVVLYLRRRGPTNP